MPHMCFDGTDNGRVFDVTHIKLTAGVAHQFADSRIVNMTDTREEVMLHLEI